jgi:DNA primase
MQDKIEEIKKRIDIVDFLGGFITLKKAGRNYKANCPFHNEKSPSFVVSPDRQIWHCFGACHDGGDVIKFFMKWENITFMEALRELAQKAGVTLESTQLQDQEWNKKDQLLKLNTIVKDFFKYILHDGRAGKKAYDYLIARKMHPNMIKTFELGYAVNNWDLLYRYINKNKLSLATAEELGLIIARQSGGYIDRFRDRIIFPIKDARGNVIGFSGRILENKEDTPKYVNTPETPLYHKRETLYGIDLAKEAIRKANNVFLVEGEFDMITPYQHGYENFVAIKGSAVTREQLQLLKRYTTRITLALDADAAGIDAVRRGVEEAEAMDFDINIVTFDFAKDPDEALQTDPIKFKKALASPIPAYDFMINVAEKKFSLDDPYNKKKFADEVTPFIGRISNPIIKSHYVKKVAQLIDVTGDSVDAMIRKNSYKRQISKSFIKEDTPKAPDQSGELHMQKYILSIIFQPQTSDEVKRSVIKILDKDDFTLPALQKLIELYTTEATQSSVLSSKET